MAGSLIIKRFAIGLPSLLLALPTKWLPLQLECWYTKAKSLSLWTLSKPLMSGSKTASTGTTFTLELHTNTADEQNIYVVGNFNQWRVSDEAFRMLPTGEGRYELQLPLDTLPELLEYK